MEDKCVPVQLFYVLGKVFEIVDAGPQWLADLSANYALLGKNTVQTPAPCRFVGTQTMLPL